MTDSPVYSDESWYKLMQESSKRNFDSWYSQQIKDIQEIAQIKDDIFDACYNLKGSDYIQKPQRVLQLIEKARNKVPEHLMTEKLRLRMNELERKAKGAGAI